MLLSFHLPEPSGSSFLIFIWFVIDICRRACQIGATPPLQEAEPIIIFFLHNFSSGWLEKYRFTVYVYFSKVPEIIFHDISE